MSAEIAIPRLQSEIKVALFLFASSSFLANNMSKIHTVMKEKGYIQAIKKIYLAHRIQGRANESVLHGSTSYKHNNKSCQ